MFIQMLDGRDAGQVLEVREEEANEMLASGQASRIDFSGHDFSRVKDEVAGLPVAVTDLVPPETVAIAPEVTVRELARAVQPSGRHFKKSTR